MLARQHPDIAGALGMLEEEVQGVIDGFGELVETPRKRRNRRREEDIEEEEEENDEFAPRG